MDLHALIRHQREAATLATEQFMDLILGEAQRLAPVREGTLRASAGRETEAGPEGITVTGHFTTAYAARQHEEVTWQHPKGGQAKYLEQPVKQHAHRYPELLAAALRRVTP